MDTEMALAKVNTGWYGHTGFIVIVGQEPNNTAPFFLHSGYACYNSQYFADLSSASSSPLIRVDFTRESPASMLHFAHWLYSKWVPVLGMQNLTPHDLEEVVGLFQFAEKFWVPDLAAECYAKVHRQLATFTVQEISTARVKALYDQLRRSPSMLAVLCLRLLVYRFTGEDNPADVAYLEDCLEASGERDFAREFHAELRRHIKCRRVHPYHDADLGAYRPPPVVLSWGQELDRLKRGEREDSEEQEQEQEEIQEQRQEQNREEGQGQGQEEMQNQDYEQGQECEHVQEQEPEQDQEQRQEERQEKIQEETREETQEERMEERMEQEHGQEQTLPLGSTTAPEKLMRQVVVIRQDQELRPEIEQDFRPEMEHEQEQEQTQNQNQNLPHPQLQRETNEGDPHEAQEPEQPPGDVEQRAAAHNSKTPANPDTEYIVIRAVMLDEQPHPVKSEGRVIVRKRTFDDPDGHLSETPEDSTLDVDPHEQPEQQDECMDKDPDENNEERENHSIADETSHQTRHSLSRQRSTSASASHHNSNDNDNDHIGTSSVEPISASSPMKLRGPRPTSKRYTELLNVLSRKPRRKRDEESPEWLPRYERRVRRRTAKADNGTRLLYKGMKIIGGT